MVFSKRNDKPKEMVAVTTTANPKSPPKKENGKNEFPNKNKSYSFDFAIQEMLFEKLLASQLFKLPNSDYQPKPGDELDPKFCRFHREVTTPRTVLAYGIISRSCLRMGL